MTAINIVLLAWAIEALFGWPDWLYQKIKHPVVWIGACISKFDRMWNRSNVSHQARYMAGATTSIIVITSTTGLACMISFLLSYIPFGWSIEAVLISSLIASRSLYTHIHKVLLPLKNDDIPAARIAVSQIVGRETSQLNASEISRASLESLAENTSDGVVAPLFWAVLFGLPGIAAYKAINTLDSMIGHKSEKYHAFGGFAARLDDIVNLLPARITGLVFALTSLKFQALKIMLQDASKHRSPNAGWPEAAMAGALNINLSGPRIYNNKQVVEPVLNAEGHSPSPDDIQQGLILYIKSMLVIATILAAIHFWSLWQ